MSDLRLFENVGIKELLAKKIVLYGASGTGRKIANLLKNIRIIPYVFCDGNNLKWGKTFLELPVISPEDLYCMVEKEPDAFRIIICSVYLQEIYQQLKDRIKEKNIYSGFSVELALKFYAHTEDNICLDCYKEKIELIDKVWSIPEKENSYRFDDSLEKRRIIQLLNTEKEIVWAFSHGKVGTTTICNSLGERFFAIHFHDLEMCFGKNGFLEKSSKLWDDVKNNLKNRNKRIKIICGVREPISRDLSGFFQLLLAYDNMSIMDYHASFMENVQRFLMQETTKKVFKLPKNYREYGLSELKYGRNFDWFNIELKKYFDIDIYNFDFDRERGYQIYQNENVEVFVYKMEKLSQLETALGVFIGDNGFHLTNSNRSEEKSYWKLYIDTKRELTLPKDYVEFYYKNNLCMDYFYTQEEQKEFLSKWKID